MPHAIIPRILFIDAYDSFSNNIISLLESELAVEVTTIKIDESIDDFVAFLQPFAAVVAGPGPGNPQNLDDVGLINNLWSLGENDLLPVLGICLGFQSLVLAFGGCVEPLPEPQHGIIRKIHHDGRSLFRSAGTIETVQYHSLHASLVRRHHRKSGQDGNCDFSRSCSSLRPLAWDVGSSNSLFSKSMQNGSNPSSILMAVEHTSKPFQGIQFHPESICSNENARKVLTAWWNKARNWRRAAKPTAEPPVLQPNHTTVNTIGSMAMINGKHMRKPLLKINSKPKRRSISDSDSFRHKIPPYPRNPTAREASYPKSNGKVITRVLPLGSLKLPQLCESLRVNEGETVIFDSETHQRPEIGTHSIIGIVTPSSLKLEYTIGSPWVRHGKGASINLRDYGDSIFCYIKYFMKEHRAEGGSNDVPFWGGLMGYITYEACLETIEIRSNSRGPMHSKRPDLGFVFVERSIVINFEQKKLYIQSIRSDDSPWISETVSLVTQLYSSTAANASPSFSFRTQISLPDEILYKSKIRSCQTSIRAGDAYELCLTTQSTIETPPQLPAWRLYLCLRQQNPSPFSAYLRLGLLTLVSSSPERFLSWSRPKKDTRMSNNPRKSNNGLKTSTCQFRPIKGTVKRITKDTSLPPITLDQATAMLSTPKERAENLMIVDLIRHDLHGVVGSGNVRVEKLMVVEEYATLFQLVTVIEGELQVQDDDSEGQEERNIPPWRPTTTESDFVLCTGLEGAKKPEKSAGKTGIDVLAASLPPGSMTGAPKRRACKLLQALEGHTRRGVYSGVVGYFDVGGGGDFSVVIRSAFRWDGSGERDAEGTLWGTEGRKQNFSCRGEFCKNPDGETKPETDEDVEEEKEQEEGDIWTIGAGGAVTILSCEDGEWEEMCAKMASTITVFETQ